MVDGGELGVMLRALVGDRGRADWRRIDAGDTSLLTSAEAAIVDRAVAGRKAEFATGRRLLRSLIGVNVEILRAANRAPVFPSGVVGSLAHDRDIAVGLVASTSSVRAVGIDVEPIRQLDDDVAELIVRPDDIVPDPLTAFVAKEATYKAWSSIGGDMLEHHDVTLTVADDRFSADVRGGWVADGVLGRAAGRLIAVVVIPTM